MTKDQRAPLVEFRLAEKALKNAQSALRRAQSDLDSARARERAAFNALSPAQQMRVLS